MPIMLEKSSINNNRYWIKREIYDELMTQNNNERNILTKQANLLSYIIMIVKKWWKTYEL